jgi:hypothetical protein
MRAYKFLAEGAVGPLSGFRWPAPQGGTPGPWVTTTGALELCVNGSHVCRTGDLAHWMHDELWELEAEGDQLEGLDCLVVRRARLVRRLHSWDDKGAAAFAEACARHATELADRAPQDLAAAARGLLEDAFLAARTGFAAVSAYASALAVARLADPADQDATYRRERAWQSAWIARVVIGA